MTAYLCAEAGHQIDPFSDFARELVAYTFEMLDAEVVDDLMMEAIETLETKTSRNVRAAYGAPK
ncbi:hypothetical protein HFO56_39470 [Rhizobium laguerreae]|uniref:hypothetical protein n=1 Tax=Rhizobium laguerreae TaxID=1076926 RepID=UPI001C923859|nr:hypothetical protein [Rhizobium laguerreae]MBY3158381.1 hypothetical protein [Rhizobium laguerreae]